MKAALNIVILYRGMVLCAISVLILFCWIMHFVCMTIFDLVEGDIEDIFRCCESMRHYLLSMLRAGLRLKTPSKEDEAPE